MTMLKTIGTNGQIALGKKYAGRHVLVEEQGEGVWVIRTVTVVPDGQAKLDPPKPAPVPAAEHGGNGLSLPETVAAILGTAKSQS